MSTVSVRDLSFAYEKSSPIFRGLSFNLSAGAVVELQGGNGVGKSTLLRLLAGCIPPTSGEISVGEANISRVRGVRRLTLARLVPQRVFEFFLYGSIEDELKATEKRLGAPIAQSHSQFDRFFIRSDLRSNPADLSELEAWRLALLMTAVSVPRLLLIDEIPSYSSRECTGALSELFASRRGSGLTTVFSTHRPIPAQVAVDRTIHLDDL